MFNLYEQVQEPEIPQTVQSNHNIRRSHVPSQAFGSFAPVTANSAQTTSRLIELRAEHFQVKSTTSGVLMTLTQLNDPVFILFYTNNCNVCKSVVPLYVNMSKVMPYRFAACNVEQQKDVVAMSEKTIRPIQFVPTLFLYAKGWPFVVYTDVWDAQKLQQFAHTMWIKAHQQMQQQQQQPAPGRIQQPPPPNRAPPSHIPANAPSLNCEGDQCGSMLPFNNILCRPNSKEDGCYETVDFVPNQ